MSAAKLRVASKLDSQKQKQATRKAKALASVVDNKAIWQEAFNSDQPLAVDDAANLYATWVSNGRQGEEAKEAAFEACKTYSGARIGWVFKAGVLGTGYYKEGVPERTAIGLHRLLCPIADLAPIPLCLDGVVGHRKILGAPP